MSSGGLKSVLARPLYEKGDDLLKERQVIDFFSQKFKCTFAKLPVRYGLDYSLIRGGEVRAFAEIKCRTNDVSRYDTYMMSLGKKMSAEALRSVTGLDCFLIVKWTDAVGYIKMNTDSKVLIGGRVDRNDWQDTEPVVHYPIDSFTLLTGLS